MDVSASSTEVWQNIGTVLGYVLISAGVYIAKSAKDFLETKRTGKINRAMNGNLLVYQCLTSVKLRFDADLVMLMQFKNGEYYNSGASVQKLGITHFVSRPGVSVPSITAMMNIPLSLILKTMERILETPHKVYTTKSMDENCLLREIFHTGGMDYHLLTTVRYKKDQILGALMICWLNEPEVVITDALLAELDEERQQIALSLSQKFT